MNIDLDLFIGFCFIGLSAIGFGFAIKDEIFKDFALAIILFGYGISLIRISFLQKKLNDANLNLNEKGIKNEKI